MNPKKHNRRRQPVHLSLLISHRRALLVGIGQIAQSRLWSPEKANTNANKLRQEGNLVWFGCRHFLSLLKASHTIFQSQHCLAVFFCLVPPPLFNKTDPGGRLKARWLLPPTKVWQWPPPPLHVSHITWLMGLHATFWPAHPLILTNAVAVIGFPVWHYHHTNRPSHGSHTHHLTPSICLTFKCGRCHQAYNEFYGPPNQILITTAHMLISLRAI